MVGFILLFVLAMVAIFVFIEESAHRMTYGKILPDTETIPFLEKNLNEYKLNPYNEKILSRGREPYISISPSVRCKWYIEDYGVITRWSKASKMLDEYYETVPKHSQKKLSDL